MIQTRDLRLGNYVNCYDEIRKVSVLHRASAYCININGSYSEVNCHCEKLEPVILTEEKLLKCGWNKLPHFTVMNSLNFDLGRNISLSIGCLGTPNEVLFIRDGNGSAKDDLICIHNFDYDGKLYLHKLQNLCHSLGQELDIKL